MKLEITTEEVLELASKSKDMEIILKSKFPDCFENGNMSDDSGKDSVPIKKGDKCFIVHGTPERFTITEAKYPNCSHGAVKIYKGDACGEINAKMYAIEHTKRFTLDDINFALQYSSIEKYSGSIVSSLNSRNHPDSTIHQKKDRLNANSV